MGFLAAIPAALAGLGTAITAGAATGGAATLLGGLTAATAATSIGTSIAGAVSGAPKPPSIPAPIAPPPTAVNPLNPVGGSASKSLANLSPGLALGGTSSFLGGAPSSGQKTLLGQ